MDQEKKLYSKVDTSMDFASREQEVIKFWTVRPRRTASRTSGIF